MPLAINVHKNLNTFSNY